jgi:hypothetical protein
MIFLMIVQSLVQDPVPQALVPQELVEHAPVLHVPVIQHSHVQFGPHAHDVSDISFFTDLVTVFLGATTSRFSFV